MSYDFHLLNEIKIPEEITSIYPLEKLVFIDIETTGFSHNRSHIINLGLLFYTTEWQFDQLWASDETEELILLTKFLELDEPDRIYICYNGKSFDFPFIASRLKHHHISGTAFTNRIIDFMPLGRHLAKTEHLSSYTLKTIEIFLGIERHQDLTGQEVVEAFHVYKYSGDPAIKAKILMHNAQDILNMPHLLYSLSKVASKDISSVLPLVFIHNGRTIALNYTWSQTEMKLSGVINMKYAMPIEIVGGYGLKIENYAIDISIPLIQLSVEHHHFTRLDWSLCYPDNIPYESLSLDKKMLLILKTNDHIHLTNIRDLIIGLFDHHIHT